MSTRQRNLCLLLLSCFLIFGGAGCTKEKALALQDLSLKLVKASEKAISDVEKWWSVVSLSGAGLSGKTLDSKVKDYAWILVNNDKPPTFAEINKETDIIRKQLSVDETLEPLAVLKEGIFQINLALKDLDKGHLFATKAVKDLKPYLEMIFKSLANLAIDLDDYIIPNEIIDPEVLSIRKIQKDATMKPELKEFKMADHLRNIVKMKQQNKKLNDEMVASLLLAASYSMDMLDNIDKYDKLSLKDIVNITNEWASLATKLSGGEFSQSEVDNVLKKVNTYATRIGVLDANKMKSEIAQMTKTGEDKKTETTEEKENNNGSETETNTDNTVPVPPPL
ncbi:MAG: hypothetical protein K8F52_14990 [Candidatus Scalindua rubra]|uniref:Lipoprotein n=1 Tax=Candidatus Scalindua brodae TaxID=237368 RepID=A0A0B0EF14_9BACT|nr:MAG: hypothetical protein SCABRO_02553 [Candidatus Scalindua brodae]MBZ0109956.1 hypothetical protein [Candidatus Scalindua rubra]